MLQTVLVNFSHDPDTVIRGVLWESRGAWLVIRNAELCKRGELPAPIDGEAVIHRDRVAFLQAPPAPLTV